MRFSFCFLVPPLNGEGGLRAIAISRASYRNALTRLPGVEARRDGATLLPGRDIYLIACGLIGEPVPPVMISGGPQKKNS